MVSMANKFREQSGITPIVVQPDGTLSHSKDKLDINLAKELAEVRKELEDLKRRMNKIESGNGSTNNSNKRKAEETKGAAAAPAKKQKNKQTSNSNKGGKKEKKDSN